MRQELLAGLPRAHARPESAAIPGPRGRWGGGEAGRGCCQGVHRSGNFPTKSRPAGPLCKRTPIPRPPVPRYQEAASGILGSGRVIPLRVPPGDSGKACFMSWQSDHSRARFLFLAASVSLDPAHCLQSGLRNRSRRSVCFQSSPYILLCFCCRTTSGQRKWQRRSF